MKPVCLHETKMGISREDVMYYSAMLAGAGTLFAGMLADLGAKGTAWACGIIAAASLVSLLVAYLHTPSKG